MCRMVGMVSSAGVGEDTVSGAAIVAPLPSVSGADPNRDAPAPSRLPLPSWQHLVGANHSLRAQAQVGKVPPGFSEGHGDSWGIGWFDDQGRVSLLRQTGSATDSAFYVFAAEGASRGTAGSGVAQTLVGHLRKASCGDVTSENAHPVRVDYRTASGAAHYETLLVAHNGTLRTPLLDSIRNDVLAAGREEARSDSDTVLLAGWLAVRLRQAGPDTDLFATLQDSLRELFQRAEQVDGGPTKAYSAVNLLIAHPDGLFALRQFSHDADYYTLLARPLWRTEDGTDGWIVASERTDDHPAWESLRAGVLTYFPSVAGREVREASLVGASL